MSNTTLHLSVINDGATYERRLRIERAKGIPPARKRLLYRRMCEVHAYRENRDQDTRHTDADIDAAAAEVHEYMARHVAEF